MRIVLSFAPVRRCRGVVAQAGFAWLQVPAFHKVSGVWVVAGFWLRWRVGIRTLPTRLTHHWRGRGLCIACFLLVPYAVPLNSGVRLLLRRSSYVRQERRKCTSVGLVRCLANRGPRLVRRPAHLNFYHFCFLFWEVGLISLKLFRGSP